MKLALILTTIFAALMTVLLVDARNHGLHPNFKAWGLMIPVIYVFVSAKVSMLKASK